MPNQLNAIPESWKEEVNRKIAAHKNRKGPVRVEQDQTAHRASSSRAAEVAARVSARYAKAPSYNEILAGEARAAARAAEAASRAAAQAHAAAQNILAGLEAASAAESARQEERSALAQQTVLQEAEPDGKPESARAYSVRWEETLPELHLQPESAGKSQAAAYEIVPEGWHAAERREVEIERPDIEVVEAGHPIPGNLIEFPSELIATRRVRPRRAEGPLSTSGETPGQLSIFEVDPSTVSTVVEEPSPVAASIWQEEAWPAIELAAAPAIELAAAPAIELPAEPEPDRLTQEESRQADAVALDPAPASMRILSAVVNLTLVLGAFLGAAAAAIWRGAAIPSLHTAEVGAIFGLLLVGLLYTFLFYVLGDGTPGLYYARMRLVTFDGHRTSRADRTVRLVGLLLSVLPLGLGLAWMLFDEEHLCWHDRLSKTYLRRY